MPWEETELAGSGEQGVNAPRGCRVTYNRSAATSTLGQWGRHVASAAPVPRHEMPGGGAWKLLAKAVCFMASAKNDGAAATVRDENSETDVLSRGTDASGYGTAAGDGFDCFTAAERTTGMTAHHLTGARAASSETAGRQDGEQLPVHDRAAVQASR